MRSVDDVFSDFVGRRRGIIKALTTEVRSAGGPLAVARVLRDGGAASSQQRERTSPAAIRRCSHQP